jgi:hypothetical protein
MLVLTVLQLETRTSIIIFGTKLYEKLSVLRLVGALWLASPAKIEEIEDLYDKSSDLPIATIIKMAEYVL